MTLTIHRGAGEIGGSCVELCAANGARLIIDMGMPLDTSKYNLNDDRDGLIKSGLLPDIPALYSGGRNIAVLLSHAHQDHYGLINYIHPDIPVYAGRAAFKLIELTALFTKSKWMIKNQQYFESGKKFEVFGIEITPFLMDHSAYDAYAFQIRADTVSLLYSGDFRLSGRKRNAFYWFERHVDKPIDYLLLEGTTIGRENAAVKTESDLEEEFVNMLKNAGGITLFYASGQNIDRLVTIYRACKRTGKTLVLDFYTATVLAELSEIPGGENLPRPSGRYSGIKVFHLPDQMDKLPEEHRNRKYRFKKWKINTDELSENPEKYVMIIRPSMANIVNQLKSDNGSLIYSLWQGYKKDAATKNFIEELTKRGFICHDIHTSGHADIDSLKRMAAAVQPKCIVPIHTAAKEMYRDIFNQFDVIELDDKEKYNMLK